jgi:hypothetical protein
VLVGMDGAVGSLSHDAFGREDGSREASAGDPPVFRELQAAGGTTSQSLTPDRRWRLGVDD